MKNINSRKVAVHLRIKGKRDKIISEPMYSSGQGLIDEYLGLAGHGADIGRPMFRQLKNNRMAEKLNRPLDSASAYRSIVPYYGQATDISAEVNGIGVH